LHEDGLVSSVQQLFFRRQKSFRAFLSQDVVTAPAVLLRRPGKERNLIFFFLI
jgi:hypothetical protein